MDRLQSMRVFCKVVEAGSFSKASQQLDLTNPVVTRLVADLERHLGARLLNRTTRSLSLTEAGREYYLRCGRILDEIDDAESQLHERSGNFKGTLRVLGGTSARVFIVPILAEYQRRYPEVSLEFSFGTNSNGLIDDGYDLAILPEQLGIPNTLVARPLVKGPLILCAAPAYLEKYGIPMTPADISEHACLSFTFESATRSQLSLERDGKTETVPIRNALNSNNVDVLLLAALSGMGITAAARPFVAQHLDAGMLVEVLPGYVAGCLDWHLIYPSRKFISAKVRTLIEMFVESALALQQKIDGGPVVGCTLSDLNSHAMTPIIAARS